MSSAEAKRNPVEELAEEFLDRYRRGERPALSEYLRRYPELAAEICDVFPALAMMEEAGPKSVEAAPAATIASGRPCAHLGDYRILREVGRGGMGIVYEAEQESLGRHVALKVLPVQSSANPVFLQRFRREARSAARLHHTNIVPVFDVGDFQGTHYYAMQFIQGQGLDEVLDELRRLRGVGSSRDEGRAAEREDRAQEKRTGSSDPQLTASLVRSLLTNEFAAGELGPIENRPPQGNSGDVAPAGSAARNPLSPVTDHGLRTTDRTSLPLSQSDLSAQSDYHFYRSVARVGLQVAEALAYAHAQKVLHRDIKPANLLLDLQGTIWVTDFGLAKEEGDDLTQTGDLVGTLRYMAPERFNGVSDATSDVYSLGLTLYELLTLRPAFAEIDRGRLIKRIAHEEPASPRKRDPHVPRDLETIVLKAIAKEPRLRYQSADDMCEDLRRFLADRPIRARRSGVWEHAWRWCRRNPLVAGLLTLVALLLTAVAGVSLFYAVRLNQALDQTRDAEHEAEQDRDRAVKAEAQGRLELGKSLLAQGEANQRSGLAGQRFKSLDLLGRAATILRAHPQGGDYRPEIRDQAITALGLSDLRVLGQQSIGAGRCTACDARLERYACLNLFGSRDVVLRRLEDDRELLRLAPPKVDFWYVDLSFSADGRYLAAGYRHRNSDKAQSTLQVWRLPKKGSDPHSPAQRSILKFNRTVLCDRAWSFQRAGGRLLYCSPAGELVAWDLETDREAKHLPLDRSPKSVSPANDGKRVAVNFGRLIKVFDLETGRAAASLSLRVDTFALAWSADDRLLAIAGDSRVYVWDVLRGQMASVLHGHTNLVTKCRFANHGHLLATNAWDGTTRLWDAASGEALATASGEFAGPFAPDDRRLPFRDRDQFGVWEVAHGRHCRTLHPGMIGNRTEESHAAENVHAADFSPDDRLLALACGDGVRLYDTRTNLELAHLPAGSCVTVLFHPDGGSLITCGERGLHRWPIHVAARGDSEVRRLGPPEHLANPDPTGWRKAAWLPGHRALAVLDEKASRVLLVDLTAPLGRSRDALSLPSDYRGMTSIAVSPDGRWAASGAYRQGGIQVWNLAERKRERLLPHSDGKGDQASFVAFSPDGRWLVSYTENEEAGGYYFWRTGTWERGLFIHSPGTLRVPPVFSRDGRLLALGLSAKQILLADANGRAIAHLSTLQLVQATPLAFSSDGSRLACATNQKTVLLWDLRGVRTELAKLDLDWTASPYPTSLTTHHPPLTLQVDAGDIGKTAP